MHPAAEAFIREELVIQYDPWNSQGLQFIAKTFANLQKVGALYLEIAPTSDATPAAEVTATFDFLRAVFQDCVGIK